MILIALRRFNVTLSDEQLILIPTNPTYVPSEDQLNKALSELASAWPDAKFRLVHVRKELWEWDEPPSVLVQAVTRDKVDFVHGFENFMAVYCPKCGQEIDMDTWGQATSRAREKDYADLAYETPCCKFRTTLNELRYDWPAGFARFSLTMMNTNRDVNEEAVSRIGIALGCAVRKVQAHI